MRPDKIRPLGLRAAWRPRRNSKEHFAVSWRRIELSKDPSTRARTMHDPSQFRFIGTPLARKEDARLITGAGRFSDDFCAPGQCWLAVVRSPHPYARIRGVDFSKARTMPGVLGTYSGADCLADKLNPIPHDPVPLRQRRASSSTASLYRVGQGHRARFRRRGRLVYRSRMSCRRDVRSQGTDAGT